MESYKWDIHPGPNDLFAQEMQEKDRSPSRWVLQIQTGMGFWSVVGSVEKPFDEDRYYVGRAPPTQAALDEEAKAFGDGLHACYQHTEAARANGSFESYDNLRAAQKALAARVRNQSEASFVKARDAYGRTLEALSVLGRDLCREDG